MPRVVKILGVILLTAIMCITYGCKDWPYQHPSDNYDTADSTWVAEFVEMSHNPGLQSIEEVLLLQQKMAESNTIDSAFLAIPAETLKSVATVLFKQKKGSLTKKDIIEQFRQHKDIYSNLPKQLTPTNNDTAKRIDLGATDLGNKRNDSKIISENYSFRTDTINGKPVRIKIKTIESYE